MDNKGLTYYKLRSPYPEDRTKNCGLTGEEIDNNFFNLKSKDIKSAYWDDEKKTVILEEVDGSKIVVEGLENVIDGFENIINDVKSSFSVKYDETTSSLEIKTPEGYFKVNILTKVFTDSTLDGDGLIGNPLKMNPLMKTGTFAPVLKVIDYLAHEHLPHPSFKGERYLTKEDNSLYGYLYDYEAVKRMNKSLKCDKSQWRVPSKEDWDGMLNTIEPCEEFKTHRGAATNREYGKLAGKFLKTNDFWINGGHPKDKFYDHCCETHHHDTEGIDSYGFKALPSGYSDGIRINDYFGERGLFWTTSELSISDIYIKRFDFNRSGVYQEAIGPENYLSVRFVKDYTGDNFFEREVIDDCEYSCILMPYDDGSMKIWTVENVYTTKYGREHTQVPNSGRVPKIISYYTAHWDGKNWLKYPMNVGDSVVIKNHEGLSDEEWRLVESHDHNKDPHNHNKEPHLKAVTKIVYDRIKNEIDHISEDVQNVKDRVTDIENTLGDGISESYGTIKDALDKLTENLTNEIERATNVENELANSLADETRRAQNVENKIIEDLQTEVERATSVENELSKKLDEEIERATNANNTLAEELQKEITRAQQAETTIAEHLQNETDRAQAAENTIAQHLQNEADRAQAAENTIAQHLQNEANRAEAAEKAIKDKVIDVNPEEPYVLHVTEGLVLKTNDGTIINVAFDGDFGTY